MMAPTPTLSVVVRATRGPEHLTDCLWSILRQPVAAMEVIVVGDRPGDASHLIARQMTRIDPRVRVVTTRRRLGPEDARDVGLEAARGTYLAILDGDDMVAGGAYSTAVAALEESGSDFVTGGWEAHPNGGKHDGIREPGCSPALPGSAVSLAERPALVLDECLSTKVFRRSFLLSVLRTGEASEAVADRLLLVRAFCGARAIDVLPDRLYLFRRTRASDSTAATVPLSAWARITEQALEILASRALPQANAHICERIIADLLAHLDTSATIDAGLAARIAALARTAVAAVPPGTLARLPVRARWQLALIGLGRPRLLPLLDEPGSRPVEPLDGALDADIPAALTAVLGLGEDSVGGAFRRRYVDPPARLPLTEATTSPGEPDISVVIPTHNVEDFVDELLNSVRAAVGVRLEIVVVDDHSTDRTWQLLQEHARQDSRLTVLRSPGRGGGEARNVGVGVAAGEWLCFADADDIVPTDAYAAMLATARRTNAEIVTGSYQKFGATWEWDGGELFGYDAELDSVNVSRHPRLITHRVCWNRLIRRDFWLSQELSFPSVPRANDVVPITKALVAASRISVVPVLSYRYRTRPGGGSMTAAQGSAAATLSYLSQEAEAAEFLRRTVEPHVLDEYWSVILPQDCWRHIRAYLMSGESNGFESQTEVALKLTELMELAPATAHQHLSSAQKAVYAFVVGQELAAASSLLATLNRVGRLTKPSALGLPAAVDVLAALANMNALSPTDMSHLVAGLLLSKPSRWQVEVGMQVGESALVQLRGLLANSGILPAVLPGSDSERLAGALEHGTVGDLMTLASRKGGDAPAVVRYRLGRCWLDGFADGEARRYLWVLATKRIGDQKVRIPLRVDLEANSWCARLRPRDLPTTGNWRLSLHWEDRWGLRESPLKLSAGPLAPLARTGPVTPGTARVTLKPSILARGRNLARAVVSPSGPAGNR